MLQLSNGLWVQTCKDIAGLIMPQKAAPGLQLPAMDHGSVPLANGILFVNVTNG